MMKVKIAILFLASLKCVCAVSQPLTFTKEERNVLQEHESDLQRFVNRVSEDAYVSLCMRYRVEIKDRLHLMNLVKDREYRKYARNFIDNTSRQRVIEKMKIDSVFQDSIDALLIPENHDISGRNISMALKLSEPLKLSNKKYKFLMDRALSFARMKRQNPTAWFAKSEMDAMKKVLSRKQIEEILEEKNRFEANLNACRIWNDLDKAKLTIELDSTAQMYLMEKYFSLNMFYRDYFVGDDETMRNNLDDLYKHRPTAIKMHEALNTRKRVDAEAKEEKKKKVSNTFAW